MIDPATEQVISLTEATKLPFFPARRGGKRLHLSCIYRWTVTGCRGVILESIQIGGTRCTSLQACLRFVERLTQTTGPQQPAAMPRTPTQRNRAIAAAEARCAAKGY
jgi:Protein of unknown function (DUF1580)